MKLNLTNLAEQLDKIESYMLQAETDFSGLLEKVHPENIKNAQNLLHYLALRSHDIREIQDELHAAGLSSMASSESHIRGQLLAILQRLGSEKELPPDVFGYEEARKSLAQKSVALFGKKDTESVPYIMVTFDSELAEDYGKVKNLLQSGMNIARINCAHDNESTWFRMIQHIKRASKITGLECKIYMDLAGPKIRTVVSNKEKMKVEEGQTIFLTDEKNFTDDKQTVGCTVPGIAQQLNSGERVLFDDGLIEARVEKVEGDKARLQVLRISSKKPFIKNEKGVNFPDSMLMLPALTEYDIKCLSFINKHADMVGYSFVRNSKDMMQLQEVLAKQKKKVAVIIKIETPEAVKNLPALLFTGFKDENTGVMIARGDLAVEIGFERMSEVQEEILWICEAAHVPVIWATQVLENLNKSGVATRSEITDAAHAALADCVMINKGEHIIQTMETLRDILIRSGGHHVKKRYTFRPLAIATRFMTK
jgi:pyruvate kinase